MEKLYLKINEDPTNNPNLSNIEEAQAGYSVTDILYKLIIISGVVKGFLPYIVPYSVTGIASITGHEAEEVKESLNLLIQNEFITVLKSEDIYNELCRQYRMEDNDKVDEDKTKEEQVLEGQMVLPFMTQDKPKEKPKKKEVVKEIWEGSPVFPLKDGTEYRMTLEEYERLKDTYPNVDVDAEIKKAYSWLCSYPSKQKTKRGMPRFFNSWMNRRQSEIEGRGRYPGNYRSTPQTSNRQQSRPMSRQMSSKLDSSGREVI